MQKFAFGAAAPLLVAFTVLAQTPAKPASSAPQSTPSRSAATAPAASQSTKPGPPAPTHPLTAAQAHELMQLTGTNQVKTRLIDNIMAYFQRAFPPYVPADVKEDLHASLEKMDIDTPTVATYQRYISTEDAEKTIEFYKTPAGKSLLEVTPLLLGEVQQSALKNGQDTARAVLDRHKTEIEAAQKTYEQQHPAQGAPTLGPSLGPTAPPAGAKKPQ